MANKNLFASLKALFPRTTARNDAGAPAYRFDAKHALTQYAATGCFNGTFYASVSDHTFLAKLAIYSRERALLKDMPAALTAALATRDPQLFQRVFDRVIDNGRVLRTLFQMIRSGQFGKRSLSSSVQRAFQRWLNTASTEKLLSASIGQAPSLRDVLRLARPTPTDNARRALFGWLTDKEPANSWRSSARPKRTSSKSRCSTGSGRVGTCSRIAHAARACGQRLPARWVRRRCA
jgi:60 kDa SS-A/Ro ribonucleoprotein